MSTCMVNTWIADRDTTEWKNLNGFVARIMAGGYGLAIEFPIWELRASLEEPSVSRWAMECRLWVASEWILRHSDGLFRRVKAKEVLSEDDSWSLRGGSLVKGIAPLSLERWEFWKQRLSECAADARFLGIGSAITDRIADALKEIAAVKDT